MRHTTFIPLLLLTALGCNGTYRVGDLQGSSGDSSIGNENGGSAGSKVGPTGGGTTGISGSTGGAGASGSGNNGGSGATGGDTGGTNGGAGSGPVAPSRWLATETSLSSTTTSAQFTLIDLANPSAAPVVLDTQAGAPIGFSADGNFLLYSSNLGNQTSDIYLVDLSEGTPGKPQFLLTTGSTMPCRWSPDSKRIACIEDLGSGSTLDVVTFDIDGHGAGAKTVVGTILPKSPEASENSERELTFLDANNLVYSYGPNDFSRVSWVDGKRAEAVQMGLGGGTIVHQSPDGRVVVKRTDTKYPAGTLLADFRANGGSQLLDGTQAIGLSDSFEAARGDVPPPEGAGGQGTYVYYSVSGTTLTQIDQRDAQEGFGFNTQGVFRHKAVVHTKENHVEVSVIRPQSLGEFIVNGDYINVNDLEVDSTESWLYLGAAQFDSNQNPIESTGQHWLSRLNTDSVDGPSTALIVDFGFSAYPLFSPDGNFLVLGGDSPESTQPMTFHLLDLHDPSNVKVHPLALPLSSSIDTWSPDSRYVSFVGGDPQDNSRRLYVVDVQSPDAAPRLVTQCNGDPTDPRPAPNCPASATFQP